MNGLFLSLNNNNNNLNSQTFQLYHRSNLSSINIGTIVNSILGSPVDISRLSKGSFDLAATQKYYNQRVIPSRSSKNSINHNNTIKNEQRCAGLSAITDNVINSKNSPFKPAIPVIQEETQVQARIHHLWNGNSWTSSLEEDCCYLEAGGDWNCKKLCPNLTIIKPNSIDNIQSLAHMNRDKNGTYENKNHAATTALCGKLGLSQNRCDSQSIYQFEARYFQYSVLAKNIRFCKDYRTNNNNNNSSSNNSSNNSNGISYMIFKFGKVSQVTGTELYAICVENNRPKQQPWICQHILTLDEMLKYFNLHKQALNVREGFLNAMRIESNCVSKVFDTDCECRAQIPKIWRTLNHGYKQYVRDMANKNINTNSNCLCGENFSGWFNDDLVSTRSNNSTNSNNSNISSNYSSSSSISDTWSVIANLGRIKSVSVDSDSNSVCSSCGSSRSSTISAISRRRKCGKSGNGRKGGKGSKGSKGDREGKIKNEDKFCFLESICSELGFSLCDDENFNHLSKALLGVLSRAIENAIKFAQKYPDTVLTQAYIDEENGFITYELVLIAEIINKKMNKYYKFAVPIAEQINSNGDKYYKAENILTPKMVVDNVRLNSENARFKKGTWIADINDITKSFYKQVDKTWYLNATSSSSSSSLVSNDDETKEYESLSVEDGDDIDNSTDNSDYDKQKFYQIGLNIHTGSKNVSQRNNRPKHNNRQGSFKYNNNNNDHYNRRRHGSNSMYNNCNNYNYNYNYNYDNHNNYDNYDYYNDCSTNYDNMNNSHFNHQCQQNSFGW